MGSGKRMNGIDMGPCIGMAGMAPAYVRNSTPQVSLGKSTTDGRDIETIKKDWDEQFKLTKLRYQLAANRPTPLSADELNGKIKYANFIFKKVPQLKNFSSEDGTDGEINKERAIKRINEYITAVEQNEDPDLAELKAQLYIASQMVLIKNKSTSGADYDELLAHAITKSLKKADHPLRKNFMSWTKNVSIEKSQISVERFLTFAKVVCHALVSQNRIDPKEAVEAIFEGTPLFSKTESLSQRLNDLKNEKVISKEKADEMIKAIAELLFITNHSGNDLDKLLAGTGINRRELLDSLENSWSVQTA